MKSLSDVWDGPGVEDLASDLRAIDAARNAPVDPSDFVIPIDASLIVSTQPFGDGLTVETLPPDMVFPDCRIPPEQALPL